MRLRHIDKFKALDNNQRIDALYEALESIFRGEAPEIMAAHDHDTQYYPRQIIDQSQQAQDLRLSQLESGIQADMERDRKIAALNDRLQAIESRGLPVAPPIVAAAPVAPAPAIDLDPLTRRISEIEDNMKAVSEAILHMSDMYNQLTLDLAQWRADQAADRAFLDQLSGAAFRDLQKKAG